MASYGLTYLKYGHFGKTINLWAGIFVPSSQTKNKSAYSSLNSIFSICFRVLSVQS